MNQLIGCCFVTISAFEKDSTQNKSKSNLMLQWNKSSSIATLKKKIVLDKLYSEIKILQKIAEYT